MNHLCSCIERDTGNHAENTLSVLIGATPLVRLLSMSSELAQVGRQRPKLVQLGSYFRWPLRFGLLFRWVFRLGLGRGRIFESIDFNLLEHHAEAALWRYPAFACFRIKIHMFHFPACSDSSLIRKASSLQIGVERFGVYEEEKDCLFVVAQLAENTHEGICLALNSSMCVPPSLRSGTMFIEIFVLIGLVMILTCCLRVFLKSKVLKYSAI